MKERKLYFVNFVLNDRSSRLLGWSWNKFSYCSILNDLLSSLFVKEKKWHLVNFILNDRSSILIDLEINLVCEKKETFLLLLHSPSIVSRIPRIRSIQRKGKRKVRETLFHFSRSLEMSTTRPRMRNPTHDASNSSPMFRTISYFEISFLENSRLAKAWCLKDVKEEEVLRTFNPILLQIITRDSRRKEKDRRKRGKGRKEREKKKLRDGFEATSVVIRTVAGP